MQRTVDFLNSVDEDTLKVLIKSSKPSNSLLGIDLPDITGWRFCDVMELTDMSVLDAAVKALNFHSKEPILEERVIAETYAKDFVSFLKHIEDECAKVSLLMSQLDKEPDPNLKEAGIDSMNRFGLMGIYYAISKNPLEWSALSELPFHIIFIKMMMDKTSNEIQENYNKIMNEKAKMKKR